jgi:hypothetical protein
VFVGFVRTFFAALIKPDVEASPFCKCIELYLGSCLLVDRLCWLAKLRRVFTAKYARNFESLSLSRTQLFGNLNLLFCQNAVLLGDELVRLKTTNKSPSPLVHV